MLFCLVIVLNIKTYIFKTSSLAIVWSGSLVMGEKWQMQPFADIQTGKAIPKQNDYVKHENITI